VPYQIKTSIGNQLAQHGGKTPKQYGQVEAQQGCLKRLRHRAKVAAIKKESRLFAGFPVHSLFKCELVHVIAVFRLEVADDDADEINQSPDAKTAQGKQLNNALPGIAKIEAMNAQTA